MQNVYTVAQVNSYIKNMFTQDFMLQSLAIKGEVSNCKYHSSGHIYFTLKDLKGTISCVMFAGNRSGLAFKLNEGQQVIVNGTVDVYERDGKYQVYAKQITLYGAGQLYEQFEQLKKELREMGMFEETYKRPIPKYIRTLGVVTAPTGAAVQDIINIASRRNPGVQIILYPAIVQGDMAVASIVNGIHALEQHKVDVIIVGRGGGSIEDLWAFNSREVAQTIFDCSIPVISAVGHETDTTIADFVADLRAPTPSAAAELAVCDSRQLTARCAEYRELLNRQMNNKLGMRKLMLDKLQIKLQSLSPEGRLREKRMLALNLEERLANAMQDKLQGKRHQLELYIEQLRGLSPLDKLQQGFSYVADEKQNTINDIHKVAIDDLVTIHVKNGMLKAKVVEKTAIERGV